MLTLIKRTIKDQRKTLLAYIVIGVVLLWMFVAFFPTIAEGAEQFSELMANYPEAFLKAFGVDKNMMIFSRLESFLAVEHYSLMWPLLLIALLISFGSTAIAGEIEKGTIEILLSQPLSRFKVFWGKYLAGLLLLFIFTLFTVFAAVPLAQIYNIDVSFKNSLTMAVLGGLFGLTILSLTMMFSSFFSERGKVASLTGGILLMMYALNIAAALKENLENLKYLSFFHYYDYNAALIEGKIEPLTIGVFLGVSLVCLLPGLFRFQKRDLAV